MSASNIPEPSGRLIESAWVEGWDDQRAGLLFNPHDAQSIRWQVSYEQGRLEAAKLQLRSPR